MIGIIEIEIETRTGIAETLGIETGTRIDIVTATIEAGEIETDTNIVNGLFVLPNTLICTPDALLPILLSSR